MINQNILADIACADGLLYISKTDQGNILNHVPLCLTPLQIDFKVYEKLKNKQALWNILVCKMSQDNEWLYKIIEHMSDPFIIKLKEIHEQFIKCEHVCPYELTILRNDFMMDFNQNKWLQVEYNCIAISFAFLSDKVQNYHKKLLASYFKNEFDNQKVLEDYNSEMFQNAFVYAHNLYQNPEAYILILVSEFEGNLYDQRLFENNLLIHGIKCIRRTFKQLRTELNNQNGNITIETQGMSIPISVVYYRTGYQIDHYENEQDWNVRKLLELSYAVKCPSISIQLVNFKYFQLILQQKDQIRRFISDQDACQIEENFAKIWPMDDLQKITKIINNNYSDFVLKPQQEGGGHNFYDEQIKEMIEGNKLDLKDFILMEKIKPKSRQGKMLKLGNIDEGELVSELGMLSYFMSHRKYGLVKSEIGGYLLRTKKNSSNEGGVATGYATLDSLII